MYNMLSFYKLSKVVADLHSMGSNEISEGQAG
jgi:hypothetical protein